MLISKNKPPQAAAQTRNFPESGEGTDGKAVRTSPHCLSESEFAGACAEQGEKSHRVCFARRRSGVERERLVCFSFASVFFCTSKENAQKNMINFPADGISPQNGNKTDELRSVTLSPPRWLYIFNTPFSRKEQDLTFYVFCGNITMLKDEFFAACVSAGGVIFAVKHLLPDIGYIALIRVKRNSCKPSGDIRQQRCLI